MTGMTQMREYTVHLYNPTSTAVRVQAEDLDEAEEKALNEAYSPLCHQCARGRDDGEWEVASIEDSEGNEIVDYLNPPKLDVITTASGLDALLLGTIVVVHGVGYQSEMGIGSPAAWLKPGAKETYTSLQLMAVACGADITVLHTPKE